MIELDIRMFNLFRFSFLVLLCIVVLTTCRADGECATSGECPNPEAQEVAEEVVEEVVAPEAGDPQCPTRAHVVYCAGKHLDTNQNGKLDRPELESAIDKLPWYGRGKLSFVYRSVG